MQGKFHQAELRRFNLRSLLRKCPHRDGKIGFVTQGTPGPVKSPASKVGADTGAISPRTGPNPLQIEAALGQKVSNAGFGPALTVVWRFVNSDQKGRGDQKVAAGAQHLIHMLSGTVRPLQVLEHLLRDDQIELLGQGG